MPTRRVGLLCGVAAPRVLRASRVLFGGLGCLVCRWAAVFLRCLLPRQISGRRAACPPASRPRRELRSARRLEARPGPAGLAAASNRSGLGARVLALALPPPTGTAAGLADLLLVAPLVFRAPDGPAAREARRPHFVRRRASKPAHALRSLRCPPHRRGLSLCVARPSPAAHGYRSRAPSIAQDSHPVVTSHIPEPTPNFACNSPESISRFELWALELQCFQTLLKLHQIELHASFLRGGRMGACWWCSGIPQARCVVVWNRRRLCLLVPVWG